MFHVIYAELTIIKEVGGTKPRPTFHRLFSHKLNFTLLRTTFCDGLRRQALLIQSLIAIPFQVLELPC